MRLQIFLDVFGLGHDVAGNETVGNLVVLREGIVKYPSTQFLQQVRLRFVGQGLHVRHVHVAVLVERGGERLVHVIGMGDLVDVVRNGMVEDVGLDRPAVDVTLQRQYLTVTRIHAEQVDVLLVVQVAELTDEIIVKGVEHGAQRRIFGMDGGFVLVQVMVGVTYLDVERRTASLAFGQIQRVEYRCSPANGGEVAYLPVIVHKGAVAVVSLQAGRIRTGLHAFLPCGLFLLPAAFLFLPFPLLPLFLLGSRFGRGGMLLQRWHIEKGQLPGVLLRAPCFPFPDL